MINSDSQMNPEVTGANLFAYCDNNPVNYSDPTGHWKLPNWAKITIGVAVIAVLAVATVATAGAAGPASVILGSALTGAISSGVTGAVVGGVVAKRSGGKVMKAIADGFMWGTISGAVSGAVGASPLGLIGQISANAAISTGAYVAQTKVDGGKISGLGLGLSLVGGALSGRIGGTGILNKGSSYAQALSLNSQTILREATRANTSYAAKSLARSASYVSSTGWRTLPISFSRIAGGGFVGSTLGSVKPLFAD